MRLFLALAALAIAGCRSPESRPTDTSSARVAAAAAPRPWYLDPAEGCDFDTTAAHPDADALLREYVARDAAGQFLQTDAWFAGAVECPGHEPGPDAFTVIDGYTVAPLARGADTVRVAVTSTVAGVMDAAGFRAEPGVVVDTVAAIRTPYGWRIGSPALRQRVLRAVADSIRRATPGA